MDTIEVYVEKYIELLEYKHKGEMEEERKRYGKLLDQYIEEKSSKVKVIEKLNNTLRTFETLFKLLSEEQKQTLLDQGIVIYDRMTGYYPGEET